MKKMIAIALTLMVVVPTLAFGQTIAVSSATYDASLNTTPGVPFDVKVWMDTNGDDGNAAEFVMTELMSIYPTIFKLGTIKINNTTLDLGDNSLGEYLLSFGGCIPGGPQVDLVLVTYGDFGGVMLPNSDVNVTLRGFQPGDTRPSSFGGEAGFVRCDSVKFPMTVGGQDGGVTQGGTAFADGTLMVNGSMPVVDGENDSMGSLKARF